MKIFNQKGSLREVLTPAEKKISLPSGQRLSAIMSTQSPTVPHRSSLHNKNLENIEESSTSSVLRGKGGIQSTVWSDGGILGNNRRSARRGVLWRLVLIAAIIIAAIIALSLGLVFGLRKTNNHDRYEWLFVGEKANCQRINAKFGQVASRVAVLPLNPIPQAHPRANLLDRPRLRRSAPTSRSERIPSLLSWTP